MPEYIKELILSDVGSWASILGIVISILTFVVVLKLKKQFMFRSRLEEHAEKLAKISSNISNCLNGFDEDYHQIYEEFSLANVELRCIQRGANGSLLSDIKKARFGIKIFRLKYFLKIKTTKSDYKAIRLIKTRINIVVAELQNVKKELIVGK